MDARRKNGEVYVTNLDDRERTEVRRLSRPTFTDAERRSGLVDFLTKRGFVVEGEEPIWVWA